MNQKGKIILIEGTDGSGKETQSKILLERLASENIPCDTMSFPRYNTPTGRIVGQCYLGKKGLGEGDAGWFEEADKVDPRVASPYYAVDRLAAVPEMEEILNSGKHLILDRYVESNMAHQGGKEESHEARIKIIKFIHGLEYGLMELPKPDKTIFLYMPQLVSMELKKRSGTELDGHEINHEHLRRAEETYLELFKMNQNKWVRIDCAPDETLRKPEDIAKEVYTHAINVIGS